MNFQYSDLHKVAPTRDPLTELASQSPFRCFIAAVNNAKWVYGFPVTNFKNASV